MLKPILILLFFAIQIGSTAFGATYYISSSLGNDSNNGTSQATPWKTLNKVKTFMNSAACLPGDSFLFKCGDIWRENVNIWFTDDHLTFDKYGTGTNPTFKGSVPISSWTVTNDHL